MTTENETKPVKGRKKGKPTPSPTLVLQQLSLGQLSIQKQDIKTFRDAQKSALNIRGSRRKQLYEIYADIEIDDRLFSCLDKRVKAVQNTRLRYVNKSGEEHPAMKGYMEAPWFSDLLELVMKAIWWGHVVIEPKVESGEITQMRRIPPHHVAPELGVIMYHDLNPQNGIKWTDPSIKDQILVIGKEWDLGLYCMAAPHVLYKRGNLGDWANLCEIFGVPFRKFTYSPTDPKARVEAERAAKESGSASYAVIPEGVNFDVINGLQGASNSSIMSEFKKACDESITIVFLGQTLTTSSDGKGSYALGDVHQSEQDKIHEADRIFIEKVLNYTARNFLSFWGLPISDGYRFEYDRSERIPLTQRYAMDVAIAKVIEIPADYWYHTYGLPIPETGPALVPTPEPPVPGGNQPPQPGDEEKAKAYMASIIAGYRQEIKALSGNV